MVLNGHVVASPPGHPSPHSVLPRLKSESLPSSGLKFHSLKHTQISDVDPVGIYTALEGAPAGCSLSSSMSFPLHIGSYILYVDPALDWFDDGRFPSNVEKQAGAEPTPV